MANPYMSIVSMAAENKKQKKMTVLICCYREAK